MIAILRKSDRALLAVADTIAEAREIRAGEAAETVTEIVGVAGYKPRIIRK